MRRIKQILLVAFGLLPFCSNGQTYFTTTEYGLSVGASQYFGDLNEHYGFNTLSPAYGAFIRKHLNAYISVKICGAASSLSYDDKYNTNPFEKQRNLNFGTDLYEGTLQAEFNFFKFVTGNDDYRFTPYLTGGIGAFYYNPYTTYRGVKYYLKDIGTEGQNNGYENRKYSNFAMCFPVGAGIKYWMRAGLNLSLEIADRFTTTDYIDDVSTTYVDMTSADSKNISPITKALADRSQEQGGVALGRPGKQRGNNSSFDQYLTATFSVSWHFTTYRCPQALKYDMIRTY